MIYRSLGRNTKGQMLVGCDHISRFLQIEMSVLPSAAALYEVWGCQAGSFVFLPSKETIVVWCVECYTDLGPDKVNGMPLVTQFVSH